MNFPKYLFIFIIGYDKTNKMQQIFEIQNKKVNGDP